uniref:Uncharacterized protein n=1 Tax=Neobodo designis TaxID=312471 RepID=A0A7S1M5Q2_NEODS|mmetsp:Transcript_33322/g.102910  ORF Transcript_33322/g.102910 Transcript_33322/m.102910 type:complete len:212 (+) Transcript_33322:58-693(+)|eukprot:CAMPEP_0174841014 /NCGR_PEP_ID=MMETSP1114-20130205/9036_1 /TAXON_ID=312471 /ORGANISM="Neobodo designis, Strain CCAP 1951/1" /LENGTH=211 /DNA_ID=CAMNT_0016075183 /DNA_START=58 /DNA_END=693 /DNA_ORIENTATION=+
MDGPTNDDMLRAHILTLFGRSDHDVPKLMDRIVRTLQDAGRNDLRFETDANGAVVTIAQSTRHAPAKHRTDFMSGVEARLDPTRTGGIPGPQSAIDRVNREIAALDEPSGTTARLTSGTSSSLNRSQGVPAGGAYPHRTPYRSFPETAADEKRASFPTSRYNGNYLLRRYGGAYPKHGNYDFYRRYGAAGQGAVTAEYHNKPNGDDPVRSE